MNYVFRALSQYNLVTCNNKSKIIALENNYQYLKDILKQINSHLIYGSSQSSCWISCSKDFNIVAEEYSIPQNGINNERKSIAVIKNHNNTCIIHKNQNILSNIINVTDVNKNNINSIFIKKLHNFNASDISKVVYDLSNREFSKNLGKVGLILKKDGNYCDNNILALGYATKSSEVLVFNEIPKSDISKILTPLEIDLLYVFSNSTNFYTEQSRTEFDKLLEYLIEDKVNFNINNLSKIEKVLFKDLYLNNINLHDIVKSIFYTQPNLDLLKLYHRFKILKKDLLFKILKLTNLGLNLPDSYTDIPIVEDTLDIIRIGSNLESETMEFYYAGDKIYIQQLPVINSQIYKYCNAKRIILAISSNYIDIDNFNISDDQVVWLYKNSLVKKIKANTLGSKSLMDIKSKYMIRNILIYQY